MRLVTRADLDGLTCAILLQEVETIDRIDFAHPKDVQDGKIALGPDDILANLPHDARAGLWFDHHISQVDHAMRPNVRGAFELAPSAARVVADHYRSPAFERYADLLAATDKLDAAMLSHEDVVNPQGWVLIGYTLDPRSGLGAFKEYFLHLMALARNRSAAEILEDEQVKRNVQRLKRETDAFRTMLLERSTQDGNVVVTDIRGLKDLPSGNRFLVYDVFPAANASVRIADGHDGSYVSIQVAHSILKRDCRTNVGDLMARHGGGGHEGAGTCQPPTAQADHVLAQIVAALKRNG